MQNTEYIQLTTENFTCNSLDGFIRRQKVTRCWRKVGNDYKLLPVSYTEDWSLTERQDMAQRILNGLASGGLAFGAVYNDQIVGFALISNEKFGSKKQYIDLVEFYVSEPFRRKGIGKALLGLAIEAAKKLGGTKLYISAHSAEESIAAYKKYGCVLAKEVNAVLAKKEPCDLQLEYKID